VGLGSLGPAGLGSAGQHSAGGGFGISSHGGPGTGWGTKASPSKTVRVVLAAKTWIALTLTSTRARAWAAISTEFAVLLPSSGEGTLQC
jgi:hypothetical protein